jgi:hypothetical protein
VVRTGEKRNAYRILVRKREGKRILGRIRHRREDNSHHHHHVQEGLGLIPVPCILKMKLVPPSLPRSPYVPSSFWFIL